MKTILVTNDDGIHGAGLSALMRALRPLGKVTAVVPDRERSGTSHSVTLRQPFRAGEVRAGVFAANGTPADCVKYAARVMFPRGIDVVVSGINEGPNLGSDVIYSGTVAGAREAAMQGIPAVAVSVADMRRPDYPASARAAARIVRRLLDGGLPPGVFLNVNVPVKARTICLATLGERIYDQSVVRRTDPRGRHYYWLAGKSVTGSPRRGTDIGTVSRGCISLTPIKIDTAASELWKEFAQWTADLSL